MLAGCVCAVGLVTLGTGCYPLRLLYSNDHIITPSTSKALIKKWLAEREAIDRKNDEIMRLYERHVDPPGFYTGSYSLQVSQPNSATKALFSSARQGTTAGNFASAFLNARSDGIRVNSISVMTSKRAGSLCLSFSGSSPAGQDAHVVEGVFSALGGTGAMSRLHISGHFISIDRNLLSKSGSISLDIGLLSDNAAIVAARPLTPACKAAMKGSPPSTTKISASLDGYAFAPAGTTTLPSGTTVYPPNSTISGSVGCGASNNLYIVVSYTGPRGAKFFVNYATDSGGKGGPPPATLDPGQDPVLLVAAPANDGYHLTQAAVIAPQGASGSVDLSGSSITLARSC